MTPADWTIYRRDRDVPLTDRPGRGTVVVLDNIRSALNVGAIFRTCDAAGIDHLFLGGITAAPTNPKVIKTALGAERMVPWTQRLATTEIVNDLQGAGYAIVAVELTDRSTPLPEFVFPLKSALIFGHEVAGVAVPVLRVDDTQRALRRQRAFLGVCRFLGLDQ